VILVDSNIPMYLVGAEHQHKVTARMLLERAITDGEVLVTDAEVLQEILHRYVAIDRRDAIEPATAALLDIVDEVFPVERVDVERARKIVLATRLSARDAVHLAIARRRGVDRILTFDRAFDGLDGIARYTG
jgi:predicted nucleic acid-binding protein